MFLSYNVITTIIITIIAIIITFFITESMDAAKWSHNTNCYESTTFTRDGYEGQDRNPFYRVMQNKMLEIYRNLEIQGYQQKFRDI